MALTAACTRESKCTISRIHQRMKKNSVQLKEVLTQQRQRAQCTSTAKTTNLLQDDASSPRKFSACICQYRRKCLCHRHFCNSRATSYLACRCRSDSLAKAENARRGLRVAIFGNEKFFRYQQLMPGCDRPKRTFRASRGRDDSASVTCCQDGKRSSDGAHQCS
jgi:hypothetical protein